MNDKRERREAVMIFTGFSILMYLAAAYEYHVGFARDRPGAIATLANTLRGIFGEYALLMCFICLGTLFAWLAFVTRKAN